MTQQFPNADRALRCHDALEALNRHGDPRHEVLIDLLADAMHWCDHFGDDFHICLAMACRNYVSELNREQHDERRMKP